MAIINTIIALWSGAVVDIPDGWALCDGNNDLPDLRNKFIVGAGDTYAPHDTGGASPHNHTATPGSHNHDMQGGYDIGIIATHPAYYSPGATPFTTDNTANLPPYYALAYIGKV